MRHMLEAIVHVDQHEMSLPVIPGLPINNRGYPLERTANVMNVLRDMTDIAMEELRRTNPPAIAIIHPLERDVPTPMFSAIATAIQNAATASGFGEDRPNIPMRWYCTNATPAPIPIREVYMENDQFIAYCAAHAIAEPVVLQEVPAEEIEEEEEEIFTPTVNQRVAIARLTPEWWFQRLRDDGYNLTVGMEGDVLWTENLREHPESEPTPASFIAWNGGWETSMPNSALRPATR